MKPETLITLFGNAVDTLSGFSHFPNLVILLSSSLSQVWQNQQTLPLFLCWPQFVRPEWPMVHYPMRWVVCLNILNILFVSFTLCSFAVCAISVQMSLIFSAGSLADIHPPCVLQSFVNHGAVLHKVFVVGDRHFCVERPSLKNFPSGPCGQSEPDQHFHLFPLHVCLSFPSLWAFLSFPLCYFPTLFLYIYI